GEPDPCPWGSVSAGSSPPGSRDAGGPAPRRCCAAPDPRRPRCPPRFPSRTRSCGPVAGGLVPLEEDEAVLADLDLVGVLEDHGVDAVAVDVRAVEAAGVGDGERASLTGERR